MTLARIGWASAALAVGGFVLALLFGAIVARRITGPLRELADGADAVAGGSLDASVPVRTRDEVGELAATFNGMTRDLKGAREELVRAERVAAWREIAQRIAHEIKNPLTPIQMAIETLQRAHTSGRRRSSTRCSASRRRPSSTRSGGSSASSTSSRRSRACRRRRWRRSTSRRWSTPRSRSTRVASTALELTLPRDLPRALADKEQLTQVVINLVENARDAVAGAGGTSASPPARRRAVASSSRSPTTAPASATRRGPSCSRPTSRPSRAAPASASPSSTASSATTAARSASAARRGGGAVFTVALRGGRERACRYGRDRRGLERRLAVLDVDLELDRLARVAADELLPVASAACPRTCRT